MGVKALGIFLMLLGTFGVLWSGRGAFYRRNEAGVQEFSSYKKSIIVPFLEKILRVISWLFVIGGVGVFFGMA